MKQNRGSWKHFISYALNIILAIQVVILLIRINKLEDSINTPSSVGSASPLQPGDTVRAFSTSYLDGSVGEFNFSDTTKQYLFFIFTTTCPHCIKNLPVWKNIASHLSQSGDIVMGISLSDPGSTRSYIADNNINYYTVSVRDSSFNTKYKITGVPTTLLISGNMTLKNIWMGELNSKQQDEIYHEMGKLIASTN